MASVGLMVKPVSGACNMRCPHCFYVDEMRRRAEGVRPGMRVETLERVVRAAFEYADSAVSFLFQGGEPTLAGVEFYEAFARLVRGYNVRGVPVSCALQTNGLEISDEMIGFLARERFLVGVSLDGGAATHDAARPDAAGGPTFERVRANLDRLRAARVECNALCVVNADVARRPEAAFKALARYGYAQFIPCLDPLDGPPRFDALTPEAYLAFLKAIFPLYERAYYAGRPVSVRNFDNWLMMLRGLPPESCAMMGRCSPNLVVESDGDLYPCDFYALDEWRLGNIADTTIAEALRSPTMRRFLESSLAVPNQCRACRWYPLCRNGCRRERDPETGINRWCEAHRGFFKFAIDRLAAMAWDMGQKMNHER